MPAAREPGGLRTYGGLHGHGDVSLSCRKPRLLVQMGDQFPEIPGGLIIYKLRLRSEQNQTGLVSFLELPQYSLGRLYRQIKE